MKARTLKITLLIGLGAFLTIGLFAQPGGFVQHDEGAGEVDSLTVGALNVRYVVEPNGANPGYDFATMSGPLVSTFAWSTTIGTIDNDPDTDNDITIDYPATGTGTITVTETSGDGCTSATSTQVSVRVINEPTATFDDATNSMCLDAIADYSVNVTLTTDMANGDMRYIVNMDGPVSAGIYTATLNVNESSTSFTIPAAEFDEGAGNYVVTFTEISDRISRKSSVTVATPGSHTLTLYPMPSTGGVYRLPN